MSELIQKTSLLENNIKKLLALHEGLKARVNLLEAENKQLKETIREQHALNKQSEMEIVASNNGNEIIKNLNNNELKNQINQLIQEIDQCISGISK